MTDRNTIAQELTDDQLDKFISELAALPKKQRRLIDIQAKADGLGITVSIMSAKSFRDTTFTNYLKKIERRREIAEQVAAAQTEGTGTTLADAAADNLAEQVFDLTNELEDAEGSLDLKKAGQIAFIISKIRQGDVSKDAQRTRDRKLELSQFRAAEIVLKQTRELKTISEDRSIDEKEKVARIRFRLFGEAPTPRPTSPEPAPFFTERIEPPPPSIIEPPK